MTKREPRKSDLHLDALYPEMPASFSQRVDDALFQARSSRTYGKRRNSRNRRGVMAACACAAAFVAVCGAALFLPSLRAKREMQAAAKPDMPTTTLAVETALPGFSISSVGPTPEPEQPSELKENAGSTFVVQERTPATQAPTATPTAKPEPTKDLFHASDVTDSMVEKCAAQLLEWYFCALDNRSIPDTSTLMETNVDTELWYYALELQIEQLNRAGADVGTLQPDSVDVLLERCEWLNDETLLATVRIRFEEAGVMVEQRMFLTLQVTDTGVRIVGFDCEGGSAWHDALKAAVEEEMAKGVEQAEANGLAYNTLSMRLHSDMLFQWWNGAMYPLCSAGEHGAGMALPQKPASEPQKSMQTGWSRSDQKDATLSELFGYGMMPLLPYVTFFEYGATGIGATVLPDSYVVYLYDDGLVAEACRGTLEQVRTAFESLPGGTYIVTFRAVLPETGSAAELATASGAGEQPATTGTPAAATAAQPNATATPAATDGENEAAGTAEAWLFAFAMEY